MALLFSNNASAELAAALTADATTLYVEEGKGSYFPVISTEGDYFYVTLVGDSVMEIVKVTSTEGDTFTIVRAQDNTEAVAFAIGDLIELRITAAAFKDINTSFSTLDNKINVDITNSINTLDTKLSNDITTLSNNTNTSITTLTTNINNVSTAATTGINEAKASAASSKPTAGTGISVGTSTTTGTPVSLATYGTAGNYGSSSNQTPGFNATFNIPYVSTDAYGRVTASTKTVKIPALPASAYFSAPNYSAGVTKSLNTQYTAEVNGFIHFYMKNPDDKNATLYINGTSYLFDFRTSSTENGNGMCALYQFAVPSGTTYQANSYGTLTFYPCK
jgi:hypothetical protein